MSEPSNDCGRPADLAPGLRDADVEAIARRVAELITAADDYLDVEQAVRRYGVSRSTLYAHAEALGAIRIGASLRFPARPITATTAAAVEAVRVSTPRRPRPRGEASQLIPIGRSS